MKAVPEQYGGPVNRYHQMVLQGYMGLQDATTPS